MFFFFNPIYHAILLSITYKDILYQWTQFPRKTGGTKTIRHHIAITCRYWLLVVEGIVLNLENFPSVNRTMRACHKGQYNTQPMQYKPNLETLNAPTCISLTELLIVIDEVLINYTRRVFQGSVPLITRSLLVCIPNIIWGWYIKANCHESGTIGVVVAPDKDYNVLSCAEGSK